MNRSRSSPSRIDQSDDHQKIVDFLFVLREAYQGGGWNGGMDAGKLGIEIGDWQAKVSHTTDPTDPKTRQLLGNEYWISHNLYSGVVVVVV